jgi:hypothetical protein
MSIPSNHEIVSEAVIRKELQAFCDKFDLYKEAADALGMTASQLSTVLRGKANVIPAKVLKKLKIKQTVVYVRPLPKITGKPHQAPQPVAAPAAPAAAPIPARESLPSPEPVKEDQYLAGITARLAHGRDEDIRHESAGETIEIGIKD